MSNNIINHISDESKYVKFDPAGTQWDPDVTHVQLALSKIGAWATVDTGLPLATEHVAGIAAIATEAEIDAGTDDTKVVSAKKLKYALQRPEATETKLGLTQYASNAEALAGTLDTRTITPLKLDYVFNNRKSTESVAGSLKVASRLQAEAGVVDDVIMTPKKVKYAIDALTTAYGPASETTQGVVQMATVAQVQQGVIREGFAISPFTFNQMRATNTNVGTVMLANSGEIAALTEPNKVITPAVLGSLKANTGQFGIVKLVTTPGNHANSALAANAEVVPNTRRVNGKPLSSDITITSGDVNCYNRQESDARYLRAVSSNVAVITGVIGHGGQIPLPAGYAEWQCKWQISLYGYLNDTWDGMDGYNIQVGPNRIVTCRIKDEKYGWGPHYGQVSYMVIGVK